MAPGLNLQPFFKVVSCRRNHEPRRTKRYSQPTRPRPDHARLRGSIEYAFLSARDFRSCWFFRSSSAISICRQPTLVWSTLSSSSNNSGSEFDRLLMRIPYRATTQSQLSRVKSWGPRFPARRPTPSAVLPHNDRKRYRQSSDGIWDELSWVPNSSTAAPVQSSGREENLATNINAGVRQ
jgi:hypothetical protein